MMGTIPPSSVCLSTALRGRHSTHEQDLMAHIAMLEQTLEELAEAVYHAQTYTDAPEDVKRALRAAQELLEL